MKRFRLESRVDFFCLPEVVIDTHVHFRGWKERHKTTPFQVLWEASRSGISISMGKPNTMPIIDTFENASLYLKSEINPARQVIDLKWPQYLEIGLTDNNHREVINAITLPQISGGKIFPTGEVTTGKLGIKKRNAIRWHMHNIAEAGKAVSVHCADPKLFKELGRDSAMGERKYLEMILKLAFSLREEIILIICHVSNRESVEMIIDAQKTGFKNLFIEIAPHYPWFDNQGTNWNPKLNPVFYKCFNALRGPEDREFLVSVLADESIKNVIIGSDSACHTTEEKLKLGLGGIPSNQEMVPVMITLAKQHGISEKRIADLISFNAARLFGIKIPHELVKYHVKKKTDDIVYNNGTVTNPWSGSKLWFPVERIA